MQSSKLGARVWVVAVYQLTTGLKGTSSMKLHRDLGISQKTAWHLAHRIRKAWEDGGMWFSGPAEAAETFVGGKEPNKHASQRIHAGRGPVGKTIVAGIKDRPSNQVAARVVPQADSYHLIRFVRSRLPVGGTLYTDDHRAYAGLHNHRSVNHSRGEYVRGPVHTNGIESFWAMLRRGYHGTYHRMSPKHLGRYVTEFAGRHNAREVDTIDQMAALFRGMVGKRLRYRTLVA